MKEAIRLTRDMISKTCSCRDCVAGRKVLAYFDWLQDNLADVKDVTPAELQDLYNIHCGIIGLEKGVEDAESDSM